MQENADGYVAGLNFSVQAWSNSANRLKFMRDLEGAKLFFPHDAGQFEKNGRKWMK
jgi:hypothetical protein